MLLWRMFLTLIPLIGISPTLWEMPSKISSLVPFFLASLELWSLDPWGRMILKIRDPRPRRLHKHNVYLPTPAYRNIILWFLSFFPFLSLFFPKKNFNSLQSGMRRTFFFIPSLSLIPCGRVIDGSQSKKEIFYSPSHSLSLSLPHFIFFYIRLLSHSPSPSPIFLFIYF
jgi:hypothetical protein